MTVLCRPAQAFSPRTQALIAEEASHLAPPDLARQIQKHLPRLREGAVAAFSDGDPARHMRHADGAGLLDRVIRDESVRAVAAIRQHKPFAEIVYQLGVVAHYVADANNPLNASGADSAERRYFADFLRYVETASPRFPLAFYGFDPAEQGPRAVDLVAARALARSRRMYPSIGDEYRRIGFASGLGRFDDRSTAFGVASVSFSRAVTDVAQVFRLIWLQAGGGDFRASLLPVEGRLRVVPRQTEQKPGRGRQ
jgi:hypothetical protein